MDITLQYITANNIVFYKPKVNKYGTNKKIKLWVSEKSIEDFDIYATNRKLAFTIIRLFIKIKAGHNRNTTLATLIKLSKTTISFFYIITADAQLYLNQEFTNNILELFSIQCSTHIQAQQLCLRGLIESVCLDNDYLFDKVQEETTDNEGLENELLLEFNKHYKSCNSNMTRTVIHTGVIGKGFKIIPDKHKSLDSNKKILQIFICALNACCKYLDYKEPQDGYTFIAKLLQEILHTTNSSDGSFSPDEELCKLTIERDLLIYRSFTISPILWGILGILAENRRSIYCTTIIVRALCAVCLHQCKSNISMFNNIN